MNADFTGVFTSTHLLGPCGRLLQLYLQRRGYRLRYIRIKNISEKLQGRFSTDIFKVPAPDLGVPVSWTSQLEHCSIKMNYTRKLINEKEFHTNVTTASL